MSSTEGRHAAEFVLSEANGNRSRGNVVIATSQTIVPGTVIGKVGENEGTISVGAPSFTGTGGGTLTKATPAYSADAQEGTYKAICVELTAAGGQFEVVRPDGTIDGSVLVGAAYDGQVKFTIADGTPDYAAGDTFSLVVTIAAASDEGQYKALNLSAADGAEKAAAIALYGVVTTSATATIAAIVADAEVNGNLLTWSAGITAPQKAAAIAQLAAAGIKVR